MNIAILKTENGGTQLYVQEQYGMKLYDFIFEKLQHAVDPPIRTGAHSSFTDEDKWTVSMLVPHVDAERILRELASHIGGDVTPIDGGYRISCNKPL